MKQDDISVQLTYFSMGFYVFFQLLKVSHLTHSFEMRNNNNSEKKEQNEKGED